MNRIIYVILIYIISSLIVNNAKASDTSNYKQNNIFFIDLYAGVQNSGIKKEDFVHSNFSPYLHISTGKCINHILAIAVGYQGTYFNYIGDSYKHKYYYLDAEFIINMNRLLRLYENHKWSIQVIAGTGILKNYHMEKINWGLTTALLQELVLNKNYSLKLKAGGIIGWSIYQHDKDILPNISIGLSRKF